MGRNKQFWNHGWGNNSWGNNTRCDQCGNDDCTCGTGNHVSNAGAEVMGSNTDVDSFEPVASNYPDFPVIDVPVTLAEVQLENDIEARINLPSSAREIKNIRKNVSLGETRVIPSFVQKDTVKLFVRGTVHANIQYIDDTSGFLRDYSVNVPFNTTETVPVCNDVNHDPSQKNSTDEVRYLNERGNGAERGQFGSFSYETYNEPVTTKLLFSAVNDLYLAKDFDYNGLFNSMLLNMEVVLVFKLKQKQQVNVKLENESNYHHHDKTNIYDNIKNIIK